MRFRPMTVVAALAAAAIPAPASAAALPTALVTTAAHEPSPSAFPGSRGVYGRPLHAGEDVPSGSVVATLSATVPPGRSTIAGRCPAGTAVFGLGTPEGADLDDELERVGGRAIRIALDSAADTPLAFSAHVLCAHAPRAMVTVSRTRRAVSPITFPASEDARHRPRRGDRLAAGQRLVVIRARGLAKGVGSLIAVRCPGAAAGADVVLAAARGLTVDPMGEGVAVRAPRAAPRAVSTIYAVCAR